MAAANPNLGDHFRRGEPVRSWRGVSSIGGDHFRRSEPVLSWVQAAAATTSFVPPLRPLRFITRTLR